MAAVTYEEALTAIRVRLREESASHCERVGQTAAELAGVYGVDVELARLAGVLHDWDRDQKRSRLIEAARADDIELTQVDHSVPYLLHARTGAAAVAEAFPGVPPVVIQAIARHTVGALDMTPLDEVVYLADMMEPARDFPGVEDLRAAVGVVSLSELFALGYQLSLAHLVRRRKRIHPETLDVWNALVVEERR